MTMFPTVEDIQGHLEAVAAGERTFIPSGLPADLMENVSKIAEVNRWALPA